MLLVPEKAGRLNAGQLESAQPEEGGAMLYVNVPLFASLKLKVKVPTDATVRADLIQRFHGYTSSEPAFVGGGFYWHFRQTMSPTSKPDYELLRQAAAR